MSMQIHNFRDVRGPYSFAIASLLRSSTAQVWEHASTIAGFNRELWPLARMTFPPALGRLTELVISAAPANPGNADLKAVAASLRFAEMAAGENERIVMQSVPFENIAQRLARLTRLRRARCRFEPQPSAQTKASYGTGSLVAPNLLMTNHQVIASRLSKTKDPTTGVVRFDDEVSTAGVE